MGNPIREVADFMQQSKSIVADRNIVDVNHNLVEKPANRLMDLGC